MWSSVSVEPRGGARDFSFVFLFGMFKGAGTGPGRSGLSSRAHFALRWESQLPSASHMSKGSRNNFRNTRHNDEMMLMKLCIVMISLAPAQAFSSIRAPKDQ
jgi:hypothetical protein